MTQGIQSNQIQVINGSFYVDGKSMDLGALMMQLNLDRTKMIDQQIADQMTAIKERNDKLKQMNELLAGMRKLKTEGKDDDSFNDGWITINGERKTCWRGEDSWAKEFGINWTDINGNKSKKTRDAQWDANIEALKGKIDSLNSDSQLDMIRLQSLIDKRNQAFDMATNMLQKDQKTRDNITSNLR